MPDLGLIREVVSLGLGAVIAMIVLIWKRDDDRRHEGRLEAIEARHTEELKQLVARLEARDARMLDIVAQNAESFRGLKGIIETLPSLEKIKDELVEMRREGRGTTRR